MVNNANEKVNSDADESGDAVSEETGAVESAEQHGPDATDDSQAAEQERESGLAALLAECSAEELGTRLLAAENQVSEMQDGFIRARAEVENIQRRSQNEIVSARKFAIEGFAQELLTVLDSLDQASKVDIDESAGEAVVKMREGLELTLKQFEKVMEKFGVSEVEANTGTRFDPERHQAISMVPGNNVESDHIVTVMQKGYILKERLLRPAMVVVAQ